MRLIDVDALMEALYHCAFETDNNTMWQSGCWVRYRAIEQVVKGQPTIEERKMGRWIYNSPVTMKCEKCGYVIKDWEWNKANYCAGCGADMRGEQDEWRN